MLRNESKRLLGGILFTLVLCPTAALAGMHTWDVREVFSNADGSIQFVELWEANGTPGEVGVGTATMASNTKSFAIGQGAVAPPTTNKSYLLATAAFAALPGAPTPDKIIPADKVPFFNPAGDTVRYVPYDSWTFAAVPTNGIDSRDRISGIGPNTPKNYAGFEHAVDASPQTIPAAPLPLLVLATLLVVGVGTVALKRRGALG